MKTFKTHKKNNLSQVKLHMRKRDCLLYGFQSKINKTVTLKLYNSCLYEFLTFKKIEKPCLKSIF